MDGLASDVSIFKWVFQTPREAIDIPSRGRLASCNTAIYDNKTMWSDWYGRHVYLFLWSLLKPLLTRQCYRAYYLDTGDNRVPQLKSALLLSRITCVIIIITQITSWQCHRNIGSL